MTRTPGTRFIALAAAVIWMGLIFGLSSLPGSAVPGRFGTLGHYILYAVLGGLYLLALPPMKTAWRAALAAVLLASLYGISDELHQAFVPGRVPDVMDWVVDTAGAVTAVGLLNLARRAGRFRR